MQNLVLLHGAIGAADQLNGISKELSKDYRVYTLNFSGHGGKPFPAWGLSIPAFAKELADFIDENYIENPSVFGYSMGGYVAMYLARHHPGKINKIITLATKFHWDAETATREVKMLDADKIQEKLPAFAEALKTRHEPNDWRKLMQKTADMLQDMGRNNPLKLHEYASISNPCLVLIGDKDKMISLQETVDVYRTLPDAQMGMLPATQHPIEQVNIPYLLFYIRQFIQ